MRMSRAAAMVTAVVGIGLIAGCGTQSSTGVTPTGPGSTAPSAGGSGAAGGAGAAGGLRCTAAPTGRDTTAKLSLPAKKTAAGKIFVATIDTNCGAITAQLDGRKAPQTVASFLSLSKSFYDRTPCHRLTTTGIYVLQCGDPTGQGDGGPGYAYGLENPPADGRYPAGTLAMARTKDPKSNGSQFFLVYRDSEIDPSTGGYSIFGHVTAGLPLLQQLAAKGSDNSNNPGDGHPRQPIGILKITVTEQKA